MQFRCADNSIWPCELLAQHYAMDNHLPEPIPCNEMIKVVVGDSFWRCQFVSFDETLYTGPVLDQSNDPVKFREFMDNRLGRSQGFYRHSYAVQPPKREVKKSDLDTAAKAAQDAIAKIQEQLLLDLGGV